MRAETNLILSVLTAICFLVSCKDSVKTMETNTSDHNSNMHEDNPMLDKMDDMMKAVPMTGDFDVDFANMMIVHHQEAIDMALIEVEKGTDVKIKTMAQNIITAQTEEQEKFRSLLKTFKLKRAKSESTHHELHNAMDKMMDEMKEMEMTGNTDKDFVMMMIPHHEAAIEMSRSLPFHGKNNNY